MEGYLIASFIGVLIGYYLGNKKFRRNINGMIANLQRRGDDDYDYEDEDEERIDDFPKIPLLYYGRPISGRDNLYFSGRLSGEGVEECLIY